MTRREKAKKEVETILRLAGINPKIVGKELLALMKMAYYFGYCDGGIDTISKVSKRTKRRGNK